MSADLTNYKHPIIQFDQRQMYEFGEGKTLLKQSEVRPEGFSYYNRVYNSHDAGGESGQGQIYHEGENEKYQEAEEPEVKRTEMVAVEVASKEMVRLR